MALNLAEHCLGLRFWTIQHIGKFPLWMTTAMIIINNTKNKMLSYRREIALQGALVLAKNGRLELGDNILQTL